MSVKLNDAQRVLLSEAFQREDRCATAPTGAKRRQTLRAADQLLESGLIKQVRAKANAPVWREDKETGLSYSLKLTAAGIKAIVAEEALSARSFSEEQTVAAEFQNQRSNEPISNTELPIEAALRHQGSIRAAPRSGTKLAGVIALLERNEGATLNELVAATEWLPHTTRAALTGLRRRGFAVALDRADKQRGSVYRIRSSSDHDDKLTSPPEPASMAGAPELVADHSYPSDRGDRKRARRARRAA